LDNPTCGVGQEAKPFTSQPPGAGSLGKEPQTIGGYGGLDSGLRAKYRFFMIFLIVFWLFYTNFKVN